MFNPAVPQSSHAAMATSGSRGCCGAHWHCLLFACSLTSHGGNLSLRGESYCACAHEGWCVLCVCMCVSHLSPSSLGRSEQEEDSSSQARVGLRDSVRACWLCSPPHRFSCLTMAGSYGLMSNFKCTCPTHIVFIDGCTTYSSNQIIGLEETHSMQA